MLNEKLLILLFLFSSTVSSSETVLKVIHLHNRPASELRPLIAPLLEDTERIIDSENKLIVKTSTERLPTIQSLIKKLDIPLASLTITVIQSKFKTAKELNAAAAISAEFPANQSEKNSSYLHGHTGNTWELNDNENRQVLRTLEGQSAYIKSGKIYPLQNISIYDSGFGYPFISTDTQFIEANSGFAVTPKLSGQQVILEIAPWSDNINQNGIIDTQGAHTSIRTKLGEWVEIASINDSEHQQQQGFLHHSYSTGKNITRILIKVDRIN